MKSLLEEVLAADLKRVGISFEREYRFHETRLWRFDFCLPEYRLGIEVEGGTSSGRSRHTKASGYEKDCEKYNAAVLSGWSVLRFTSKMVRNRIAERTIIEFIGRQGQP